MKTLITTLAATLAFAAPVLADGHQPTAEELFAMSNNSAAEIMLNDDAMSDDSTPAEIRRAEMRFALGNMSAAERMAFFEADMATRREILEAQKILFDGDSAAEK